MAHAYFAAGCFWGVQTSFDEMAGVQKTRVGYMGGDTANPTYEQVCTGKTNHAEAIEVTYDPAAVSYQTLLETFFDLHDPTQLNRQGPDVGTQYRSAVFVQTDDERSAVANYIEALDKAKLHAKPIATTIEPYATFYAAEDYHQKYLEKRGLASCHIR